MTKKLFFSVTTIMIIIYSIAQLERIDFQKVAEASDQSVIKINQSVIKIDQLVNKENTISSSYKPKNMVVPQVEFAEGANATTREMVPEAVQALEKLFADAKQDGITLTAVSGYRSYDYQKKLYARQVEAKGKEYADKYVAKPGSSEHQTGLAMDVDSHEKTHLSDSFANTEAYKWLAKNSAKYGFIIRYPEGKEGITGYNFEPWHLRYVGKEMATKITEKNVTLEEYLTL